MQFTHNDPQPQVCFPPPPNNIHSHTQIPYAIRKSKNSNILCFKVNKLAIYYVFEIIPQSHKMSISFSKTAK